jgi:hypothetical protein
MATILVLSSNDFPIAGYTNPEEAYRICTAFNEAEQIREDHFNSRTANSLVGSGLLTPRRRFYHVHTVPLDPETAEGLKR